MSGNSTLTRDELIAVAVTPSVGGTLIIAVTVGLCIWWFRCRPRPEKNKSAANQIVIHGRGPPMAPFDDEPIYSSFRHTRAPTRVYDSGIDPQGYYENSYVNNPATRPSNGFVKAPDYPRDLMGYDGNAENTQHNPLFEHYPTRTGQTNPNVWSYQAPSDVDGRAEIPSVSRGLQDNSPPNRLPRYDPSVTRQPQAPPSYPYQQATQRHEDTGREPVTSYGKPVYYYDDTFQANDVQWDPRHMNWSEKKEFKEKMSIPRAYKKSMY